MTTESRPFRRTEEHYWLAGVCGGLAYTLGVKVWIVRLLVFLAVWFSLSIVFWMYLALALFAPKWSADPSDFEQLCE